MSAYEFEPPQAPSTETTPDLNLLPNQAPEGAFFEIEPTTINIEPGCWPTISFEISEQNIFGSVLATNANNRARSAARSLQDAVPGLIDEAYMVRKDKAADRTPGTPIEIHKDVVDKLDTFLKTKTSAKVGASLRSSLVSKANLMQTFTQEYRITNHPVLQLMDEIAARNELRQYKKDQQPNLDIRTLSQKELEKLCDDLIIVVEAHHVLETAKQQVKAKLKQLAAQLAIDHTINPDEL